MNNASVQQRRRRRDAAAAATVATAGNHQFQGNNGKKYDTVFSIWILSLEFLNNTEQNSLLWETKYFLGIHGKYNGDPLNSAGFGLSPSIGDNMGMRNDIDIHYNQQHERRDDPNSTSSYSNYDRLGGIYDHMQGLDSNDSSSGGFLSQQGKPNDVANKPSLVITFPKNSTGDSKNSQQMPIDKSPDVIPHGIGKSEIML